MQIKFYLIIILFLFSCKKAYHPDSGSTASGETAFQKYYQALAEVETGNFDEALVHLNQAISARPGYVQFYFVKGQIFEFLEKPDSAVTAYELCLRYKSFYPEVWVRLSHLFYRQKKFEKAASYLRRSVEQYPDSINLYLKLGHSLYRFGQYRLAADYLNFYYKNNSVVNPQALKWLGLTHFELQDYRQSAFMLMSFLKLTDGDFEVLKYLGLAKYHLGEKEEALTYLNRALTIQKNDAQIYLYRARYFKEAGKEPVAREQLNVALSLDSVNVPVLYELGVLHFEIGDLQKSESFLKKAVDFQPTYWPAYRYLGLISEKGNLLKKAAEYYRLYLANTLIDDKEIADRLDKLAPQIK